MHNINNNKGITLLALTIYIIVFIMIIGIMTTISSSFYTGIEKIVETPKYAQEINKFIMFFSVDVKNYDVATVTDNSITFPNGTEYVYENKAIYRDDELIANNVNSCNFSLKYYNVNSIQKNIITVNIMIGDNNYSIDKQIDFTLKYW